MADEVLEALRRKQVTDVHVLGRRGPAYTAFTTKELRELGADPRRRRDGRSAPTSSWTRPAPAVVGRDKVAARNLAVLREWADRAARHGRPAHPPALLDPARPGRSATTRYVEAVEVERTALDAGGLRGQRRSDRDDRRAAGGPFGRLPGRAAARCAVRSPPPDGCRTRRAG